MSEKMQEYFDKEKILIEQNRFNNYQKEYERKIREADNNRLSQYYSEFLKNEQDPSITQGAYKFLQFMLDRN
jgi:hypothetical protein